MRILRAIFDFFASYGLACVIFLFLFLVVFLGTLEQAEHGLYDVQQRYFESFVVVHYFLGVLPVPLPGVYLLLILLAISTFCGGIIRIVRKKSAAGVFIAHAGILILFAGGFIKYEFSEEGFMRLYEGEQSNEFESYHEWEIAIWDADQRPVREYLIPQESFEDARGGQLVTFTHDALPFDLELRGYMRNARPQPVDDHTPGAMPAVDGFYLRSMPRARENEQNMPGLFATVRTSASNNEHPALLSGFALAPWVVEADGRTWAIDLRRKRRLLPFTIALDEFTHEFHPGTQMPRVFLSDVTKYQDGVAQSIKITMNQPLRHEGYTFYQASWGPQDAPPGAPLFSTFAVVRDPAESIPMYASLITTAGMLLHFSLMLGNYLRSESRTSSKGARS